MDSSGQYVPARDACESVAPVQEVELFGKDESLDEGSYFDAILGEEQDQTVEL